jgi:hypothetical protein
MPSFTKIVKYLLALAYDSLSTKNNAKTNEETIESPEELTFTNRLETSADEYTVIAVNVVRMLPRMISFFFQILCDIVIEYAFLILLLAIMIICVRLEKKYCNITRIDRKTTFSFQVVINFQG